MPWDSLSIIASNISDSDERVGDGGAASGWDDPPATELDLSLDATSLTTGHLSEVRPDIHETHADRLSSILATRSASPAGETADAYASEGATAAAFARTYGGALDEVVTEAFDLVRAGRVDDAEAALKSALKATVSDMAAGLERYDDLADHGEDRYADAMLSVAELLEFIPFPIYVLDADNRVVGWNEAHSEFVDVPREQAMGETSQKAIVEPTYSEGSRKKTLADKVIDAPRTADSEYDIQRFESMYFDGTAYYDTSTATVQDGQEVEIEFWAVPMFDDEGELLGVFEVIKDRTEEVRRREGLEVLVGEVTETLQRIGDGDLTARASFDESAHTVEDELLDIVAALNDMAADFESLVGGVKKQTERLADSVDAATAAAGAVDESLDRQNTSLEQAAQEMEDYSATMEEIASTSNEVASAATRAREEVQTGTEAATEARSVANEVRESSVDLLDTVSELSDHMDQIDEVVTVIDDVAEQTNILALNANIEAARAGEDGNGFAVVADEVKDLADQTREYTDEITEQIGRIEARSEETVEAVESSHEKVAAVDDSIQTTVDALDSIAEAVEAAADGITEVADANDDQASHVEGVMAEVDDARTDAERATERAATIVDETDRQRQVLDALQSRVDDLSASTDR